MSKEILSLEELHVAKLVFFIFLKSFLKLGIKVDANPILCKLYKFPYEIFYFLCLRRFQTKDFMARTITGRDILDVQVESTCRGP